MIGLIYFFLFNSYALYLIILIIGVFVIRHTVRRAGIISKVICIITAVFLLYTFLTVDGNVRFIASIMSMKPAECYTAKIVHEDPYHRKGLTYTYVEGNITGDGDIPMNGYFESRKIFIFYLTRYYGFG